MNGPSASTFRAKCKSGVLAYVHAAVMLCFSIDVNVRMVTVTRVTRHIDCMTAFGLRYRC